MNEQERLEQIMRELEASKLHMQAAYRLAVCMKPGTQEAACDILRMHLKEVYPRILADLEGAINGEKSGMFPVPEEVVA